METTRIDRFVWAVRLYPTRSAATAACQGGHIEVNGRGAKPATPVHVGDRVEATVGGRVRILEVVRVIDKRVGAPVAAECAIDHSPPPPTTEHSPAPFAREHGAGRPTKRDRRKLDRLRQR